MLILFFDIYFTLFNQQRLTPCSRRALIPQCSEIVSHFSIGVVIPVAPMFSHLKAITPRRLLFVAGLGALLWYGFPWLLPLPASLTNAPAPGRTYLASDGTPLRQLLNEDGQRVMPAATLAEIPSSLTHRRAGSGGSPAFFSHGGVDLLAIARAAWDNGRFGRVTSGASTITQQLIQNQFTSCAQKLVHEAS